MTEAKLAEIEARMAPGTIIEISAQRTESLAREVLALVAEVRRLREMMCRSCLCRADHEPRCQCWNDE